MMAKPSNATLLSCGRSLGKKSASFRLHSPSLNSLRLRRIFDLFDKNGDGAITVDEIGQALSVLGLDADFSELAATVRSYIRPGSQGLLYDDFVALHESLDGIFCSKEEEEEEQGERIGDGASKEEMDLSEAFKVFDEDGDGYISAKELQAVLGKLGLPEGTEMTRVRQMIVSVDRNNDGQVDFHEFKDMMRGVIATAC
ncbi:hypothetical protein MLD38_023951 [Melastoma candidum]|uniref:Uncharacterized protein n=1 Tax=Melastoma candidum TaxID=119954 RepID=A0ACB9NU61_9MYRT|nr:hypothetical protein MLD38_023951 [Melastoma candidum]